LLGLGVVGWGFVGVGVGARAGARARARIGVGAVPPPQGGRGDDDVPHDLGDLGRTWLGLRV
jgi:hypothetical protein